MTTTSPFIISRPPIKLNVQTRGRRPNGAVTGPTEDHPAPDTAAETADNGPTGPPALHPAVAAASVPAIDWETEEPSHPEHFAQWVTRYPPLFPLGALYAQYEVDFDLDAPIDHETRKKIEAARLQMAQDWRVARSQAIGTKDEDPIYTEARALLPPEPPKGFQGAWNSLATETLRRLNRQRLATLAAEGGNASSRTPEELGARPLTDVPRGAPPPLLLGKLDPTGHTILFGEGGVGKGTTAAWWIVQLTRLGHRVLVVDYEGHPEEWSRRIFALGGADAVASVIHVAPLSPQWTGERGPIWVQQDDLRMIADQTACTYVVVDSIVPACTGTDVGSGATDAPSLYRAAVEHIARPVLSIAHVTKEGGSRYPFGSVFWHNLARFTWAITRSPNGTATVLKNRKHNNYERQADVQMTVEWHEGLPREVSERAYSAAIADLIYEVLTEPMTAAQIVAALNADVDEDADKFKKDSVEAALRRGLAARAKQPQRFRLSGGRYGRNDGSDGTYRDAFASSGGVPA
jgi:hypothetical protein